GELRCSWYLLRPRPARLRHGPTRLAGWTSPREFGIIQEYRRLGGTRRSRQVGTIRAWARVEERPDGTSGTRVFAQRPAGHPHGYRHRADALDGGRAAGARSRPARPVREQPQADRRRLAAVPRDPRQLPPGCHRVVQPDERSREDG